jgi:hypothetical protein
VRSSARRRRRTRQGGPTFSDPSSPTRIPPSTAEKPDLRSEHGREATARRLGGPGEGLDKVTEDELDQLAKEMYDAMLANIERLEQSPPKD